MASRSSCNQQAPVVHRNVPHPARRGKREATGTSTLIVPVGAARSSDLFRAAMRPAEAPGPTEAPEPSLPSRSDLGPPAQRALARGPGAVRTASAIKKWSDRRQPDRSRPDET